MRARLSITFRCACLLLAVAAASLWVRSHHVSDSFRWNVSPPPPVSTGAPATNGTADALFLLLKSQDFAKSYRSVETIPGRLVVERQTTYEVFV
jgi:hypothetical protein